MGNESVARASFDRVPDSELDLPGIWSAIMRRKKLIGGVSIAALAAALVFIVVIKPRYSGEAKILVENQESYFTRPEKAVGEQQLAPDSEAVTSQVQLITSREIAREAIRQLNLKGNAEFDPLAGGESIVSRLRNLLGAGKSASSLASEDRIFEAYSNRLTVFAMPKSRVISVEFNAQDPDLAARGANTIADIYMDMQAKAKRERASLAATSLASIVNELRSKLAEAESKLETFRANSGLLQGTTSATISNQQLGELSTQLAAARNTMADAQAKSRLIRGILQRGRLDEITDVAKDELVRRLSEQRAALRGRLAFEARTLGPSHPRILELNAQLASAESELRASAERSAKALENDARIASSRVDNILAAIESEKRRVGGTGSDQAQLRELELEAKLIREQLEGNTTKYREALARQQSMSTPADARIISRAVVPEYPSFPKKIPILIFAALGGFILSLAWVVAGELLSGRALRPAENGPRPVPMPIEAGAATRSKTRENDANADPVEALDPASIRFARRLLAINTRDYATRILVCPGSPMLDAGFCIEPFARAISAQRRVVLVDFGGRLLENQMGLSDVLAGEAGFADVIERDQGSRLHLIGRGAGEVDIGADLDAVIDALSQTYDFVFMLAPQSDDGAAFVAQMAPAADKAVVLIQANVARDALRGLQDALKIGGAGEVVILPVSAERSHANDSADSLQAA